MEIQRCKRNAFTGCVLVATAVYRRVGTQRHSEGTSASAYDMKCRVGGSRDSTTQGTFEISFLVCFCSLYWALPFMVLRKRKDIFYSIMLSIATLFSC